MIAAVIRWSARNLLLVLVGTTFAVLMALSNLGMSLSTALGGSWLRRRPGRLPSARTDLQPALRPGPGRLARQRTARPRQVRALPTRGSRLHARSDAAGDGAEDALGDDPVRYTDVDARTDAAPDGHANPLALPLHPVSREPRLQPHLGVGLCGREKRAW